MWHTRTFREKETQYFLSSCQKLGMPLENKECKEEPLIFYISEINICLCIFAP